METLQIKVSRIYTDMNGTIIDKSLVPASMQKKMPFYLFNTFDKNGGFYIAQTIKPLLGNLFYLYNYAVGAAYNFLDFQLGNTIKNQLSNGDLVIVLGDDPNLPTILCHIVLHSDYVSYASFLNNIQGKTLEVCKIQYVTDNENNWHEGFSITGENDLGIIKENQIQPIAYRTPDEFTSGLLDMNINLSFSDKIGLNSYMLFDTDSIELTFYIKKILNQNSNGNTNPSAILYRID